MDKKLKTNELIETYSEYLIYQKGLSQNTVDSYISDLKKLSNYLQNSELSQQNIENYFL
jgi:site-specific recombinase XerD